MSDRMSLGEIEGSHSLSFACGGLPVDDVVAAAGHEPNGYFWEGVAQLVAPDLMAQLDPRDRYAVFEVKGKGRSRDDIARELGVSPPRVSQITTATLRKLRDAFGKEGLQR